MDGYSVTEAASILGVPTEKVWELIARGVLAGAQDGERGMRVFLQGRPHPPAIDAVRSTDAPPPREPDRELSPFRELLTEFRNLTERYGQALLALGEARGEVAALRSRVDLLEARMDLRLPPPAPTVAPPVAEARWVAPTPEPAAGPPAVEPELAIDPELAVEPALAEPEPELAVEPALAEPEPKAASAQEDVDEAVVAEDAADPGPVVETPMGTTPPDEAADEAEVETAFVATAVRIEAGDEVPAFDDLETPSQTEIEPEAETEIEPEAETEIEPEAETAIDSEAEKAASETHAQIEPEPEIDAEPGTEADQAPSRRRTARWTTETFAEALARAEDPTEPELPGTQEAAAALAALRDDVDAGAADLPRDTAVAEEIEAVEELPAEPEREQEPLDWPMETRAEPAPASEPAHERAHGAEPAVAEAEPSAAPLASGADRPDEQPTPEAEPLDGGWDRERYTTAIEEPDWYAEIERPFELTDAVPAPVEEPAAPTIPEAPPTMPEQTPEQSRGALVDEPPSAGAPSGRSDEEELLWFGARAAELAESSGRRVPEPEWPPEDGAAEMEVAGSRAASASAFPGGPELRQALSALDALARESRPVSPPDASETRSPSPWTASFERPTPAAPRASTPSGPASRAYRRLRRIFPG